MVPARPPATNTPVPVPVAPYAMALHRFRIVREFGTSLQLIPSYEKMSEFVVSPPATQTPLPTPLAVVPVLVVVVAGSTGAAYAIARTFNISVVAFVMGVQRIPF